MNKVEFKKFYKENLDDVCHKTYVGATTRSLSDGESDKFFEELWKYISKDSIGADYMKLYNALKKARKYESLQDMTDSILKDLNRK